MVVVLIFYPGFTFRSKMQVSFSYKNIMNICSYAPRMFFGRGGGGGVSEITEILICGIISLSY